MTTGLRIEVGGNLHALGGSDGRLIDKDEAAQRLALSLV